MPVHGGPPTSGQEAEALVEASEDFGWRQSADPCGGQLEGQRKPVKALADTGDGVAVGRR